MNGVPVFKRNNEDMITFLSPVGIFFTMRDLENRGLFIEEWQYMVTSIFKELINPLNSNIKVQILICCPYTFSIEVVRRIC